MDSTPLRILYLIDEMEALTAGGTERQVLQMAQLLTQAGAHVRVATLRGSAWLTAEHAGCPVEHFHVRSYWRLGSIAELVRLYRWMRAERFAVVQTFFVEANIIGPLLARAASTPVILGSRRNLNYWMGPVAAWLQRLANRFVTRLVANCEAVKKYVVETEGIPVEKVDVIYNGLDAERFAPNEDLRSATRARFGYRDSDVVIGSISVLRPVKGCQTLIESAFEVCRRDDSARFALVGDGPQRRELEQRAAALGDRFQFLGAQEDVRPFLNMFDVAVLSSESEGFSNSVLEYLAAGLPSVVTDVGGNSEAVENAGFVIPPKHPSLLTETLIRLLKDPAARRRTAESAIKRSQAFNLDSTQKRLISYYARLAQPAGAEG